MKSTINSKKRTGRISSIVLVIALLMLSGLMAISVHAEDATTWLDISKGDIVIGDETVSGYDGEENEITTANTEGYTITGTSTEYSVQITGGTHNVFLNNVNISFNDGNGEGGQLEDATNAGTIAFDIQGGTVTMALVGENTLQSGVGRAGLSVAYGATVTVGGEGKLTAIGGDGGAGIGGGSLANAGTINMISGYITAIGNGGGAGIGGGHSNDVIENRRQTNQYGSFTAINISGGTVVAKSTGEAPAIGTGDSAKNTGSIAISDAVVIAETMGNCPAIGAYQQMVASAISITDSIIYANNSESNTNSIRGNVTSATSIVEATTGTYMQGSPSIGSDVTLPAGYTLTVQEGYSLTVEEGYTLTNNGTISNIGSVSATESILNNGTITNFGTITNSLLNNGSVTNIGTINGEVLAASTGTFTDASATEFSYLDASGASQTCSSFTVMTPTITTWDEGWYVVAGKFEIDNRISVNGNVHLILLDGSSLTVNGGIGVGSEASFNIYAQSTGDAMGELIVQNCGNYYAGIGGGDGTQNGTSASGNITINGGHIASSGGMNSAGIGGSANGATGVITINGGVINAIGGGANGVGIGGNEGTVASIIINDGNGTAIVKANSISDHDDASGWSGIIFEGTYGTVYGTPTLTENYTVEEGEVLYIGEGASLTVAEGVTLTNNGTIVIYGTFTANGTLLGSGKLAYPVESSYTDITSSNNTAYTYTDEDYTVTLSVAEGLLLPLNVEVTLDGAVLTCGTHYTYNSESGELVIFKKNITGVIGITAQGAKIYDVWIGDVQITDRNKDNVLAGTDNDGKVSYDPTTDSLILTGATIVGIAEQNNGSAIYSDSALTMLIMGENTVTAANVTSGDSIAIHVNENLTITGEGTMTVTGADSSSASVAIQAYGVDFDGATVVAKGGAATGMSAGFRVSQRQFALNGGNITAEGGTAESSYGIVAVNFIINDGVLNATGSAGSINASRITVSPLLNHLVYVKTGEDAENAIVLEDSPLAVETVITKLASDSKYLFVESKVIKSIVTVEKTDSNEDTLEDTYTIYYTDGSTDRFVVKNGRAGDASEAVITPELRINEENDEWEISYDGGENWTSFGIKATGADGTNGTNGTDGVDGKDGTNGIDGVSGITPELRINEKTNEWEVSYDGGENWTSLGVKATGADGTNGKDGTNGVDGGTGVAIASIIISSVAMIGGGTIVALYLIKRKKGGIV